MSIINCLLCGASNNIFNLEQKIQEIKNTADPENKMAIAIDVLKEYGTKRTDKVQYWNSIATKFWIFNSALVVAAAVSVAFSWTVIGVSILAAAALLALTCGWPAVAQKGLWNNAAAEWDAIKQAFDAPAVIKTVWQRRVTAFITEMKEKFNDKEFKRLSLEQKDALIESFFNDNPMYSKITDYIFDGKEVDDPNCRFFVKEFKDMRRCYHHFNEDPTGKPDWQNRLAEMALMENLVAVKAMNDRIDRVVEYDRSVMKDKLTDLDNQNKRDIAEWGKTIKLETILESFACEIEKFADALLKNDTSSSFDILTVHNTLCTVDYPAKIREGLKAEAKRRADLFYPNTDRAREWMQVHDKL